MTTRARPTSGWRCPQCGRRFLQRTREHSCEVRTLDAHFVDASDDVKHTFAAVQAVLDGLGPYGVVPVKTMILLRGTANFGSIIVRRRWLDLGFISTRMHRDPRIQKTEPLGPKKYAYQVRLTSHAEVDAQIAGWLREAYQLGVRAKP